MQVQHKSAVFLLPGMLLFFGLSILLFNQPSQYPLIALLFFTFVLATAVLVSLEMAAVFGVLVTLIVLGGVGIVQGTDKAWLAAQIVLLWTGIFVTQCFATRQAENEKATNDLVSQRQESFLSLKKEKESLEKRLEDCHWLKH